MSYCNECESHEACATGCIKGADLLLNDLVNRLRTAYRLSYGAPSILTEAADEIERLRKLCGEAPHEGWAEVDGFQGVLDFTGHKDATRLYENGGAVFCITKDHRFMAYRVPPVPSGDVQPDAPHNDI